ncbi:MAG: 2-C-methyl-D-erythritol 4-phosphate cytidylyltransferase [Chloroflexi bacterium]|nr:2-C-methyl-D-erythritol 4-phosphate cytidylyltransferase [Chloroflexota bacterium]
MSDVQGILLAAGKGVRLGEGPKAFLQLGDRTLLERAVDVLRGTVDRIVVAVGPNDMERARTLVGGPKVLVITGGATRMETQQRLAEAADAPWLVLHDVVHPSTTSEVVRRVLAAARESGAASAGVPSTVFHYRRDGTILSAPGEALIPQKPVVFRRSEFLEGIARFTRDRSRVGPEPSTMEILELAGRRTTFVPGVPGAIKLTWPEELHIARHGVTAAAGAAATSAVPADDA